MMEGIARGGNAGVEEHLGDGNQTGSHLEALKATSIMGGTTVIVMLIRMARTKVLAVLLGPVGVGLEGIFESILSVARTIVDMGISTSGVRQIAAGAGSLDTTGIARTVTALRRVCFVLGLLGAVAVFAFREGISRMAFGHGGYAGSIGWLSLVPLMGAMAGGQSALLQGMRRIGDLAKINVVGAAITAILSIPLVALYGFAAIPFYLVATAGGMLLVSWFYVLKVPLEKIRVRLGETVGETWQLVRLGLVFLACQLMTVGASFVVRVMVTREIGVDGAGQFQAASALSLVYVGFVLQAMGTDFYPRLTGVASDNMRCNRMVNEQAEVSVVLALPGVLATIALAPWVVLFFYSERFAGAAEVLSWQALGMLLRIISWPMGFILVAKGRGALMFWTDFAAYGVYVALGWVGLKVVGLPGVGMAFLGLYAFHAVMIYVVVRRVSGFRWTVGNVNLGAAALGLGSLTLGGRLVLHEPWASLGGMALTGAAAAFCVWKLGRLVGFGRIKAFLGAFGIDARIPECLAVRAREACDRPLTLK